MKIKVFTNVVYGGWSASELETGIGGSEEKLIEWAKEMAKEHDVTIYHNGDHGTFDGVKYVEHSQFKPWEKHDVFISFKARGALLESINADLKVHWTTEVEPKWEDFMIESVDKIIVISEYQKSRMNWSDKIEVIPLWADTERLDKNKTDKEAGSILYCSSYDRGLEELLVNWDKIKEKLSLNKLYVTYGWDFMRNMIKNNPQMIPWKERIESLMKRDDIEVVGRLSNDEMCKMYWKCESWCLPLNNPDSELFCINAIKAQYCEAMPLVRRIGALQETVKDFVDWDEMMGQKVAKSHYDSNSIATNKAYAEEFSLGNVIKKWQEIIKK